MTRFRRVRRAQHGLAVVCALLGVFASSAGAQQKAPYSPYVGKSYPENVYWGDAHLHTSLSLDADLGGALKVSPEQTYAFVRGEKVISTTGQPVQLRRPLDFVVVADHAAYLGIFARLRAKDPLLLKSEIVRRWIKELEEKPSAQIGFVIGLIDQMTTGDAEYRDPDFERSVWLDVLENAEKYNEPGVFTAFAGYEWTSMAGGNNLHRVVVYRDGIDKTSLTIPYSTFDSQNPEDLWAYFENYERETGGEVLAIPHNGNLSNGQMFAPQKFSGDAIDLAYARSRARWEPLFEATQIKGDSETHPLLSPGDPYADFETWDDGNLDLSAAKEQWMLQYEYARAALKSGLAIEQSIGVNPFKFGMIGSTDSHTGVSAIGEDNFWGKVFYTEPSRNRLKGQYFGKGDLVRMMSKLSASGYAGVWALDNTREAIFDAMKRRETYATTGPRMTVRFFGGWNFDAKDAFHPRLASIGYGKGVPMGGELTASEAALRDGRAPAFLVRAVKDPDGANLDRVQIVKGWVDADGKTDEKVYDVALSDSRKPKNRSVADRIDSTVDLEKATYANSIGDAELSAVWKDPDFDPGERAFYYVRVLEIPTPRWTAYDAAYFDVDLPDNAPAIVQERAYSSPIWYTP